MSKLGVGVGEEFPVNEPPQGEPEPRDGAPGCGWRGYSRRHGWVHFALGVMFRLAIIGLIVAAAVSFFRPHPFAPYGYYPYPHHVFFPFFPLLLIFVVAMACRASYWRHRHWHDHWHWHRDRGEGA